MNIAVVPVAEDLIEGYHRAVESVAREGLFLARTAAPPFADAQAFVRENIAQGNAHYLAMDGATVVGWCDIVRSRREAFTHCGTLGMGLMKEYRGRGVGTRLLQATLEHARRQGLERVELEVFGTNHAAIALYEKFGFRTEGKRERGARLGGAYMDVVMMALFLPPASGQPERAAGSDNVSER